jgi:hypothetical protein
MRLWAENNRMLKYLMVKFSISEAKESARIKSMEELKKLV